MRESFREASTSLMSLFCIMISQRYQRDATHLKDVLDATHSILVMMRMKALGNMKAVTAMKGTRR
jgi:hypothetical protein